MDDRGRLVLTLDGHDLTGHVVSASIVPEAPGPEAWAGFAAVSVVELEPFTVDVDWRPDCACLRCGELGQSDFMTPAKFLDGRTDEVLAAGHLCQDCTEWLAEKLSGGSEQVP